MKTNSTAEKRPNHHSLYPSPIGRRTGKRRIYHGTAVGHLRLLQAVLFGSATGNCRLSRVAAAAAALVLVTLAGNSVQGATAPIIWNSPSTISGFSDVSLAGTLFGAVNTGGSGVGTIVVNGVPFIALATNGTTNSFTSGNFTLTDSNNIGGSNSFGSTSNPFSSLSNVAYKRLLQSASTAGPKPLKLTINGLTAGQDYLVELWVNESSVATAATETISAVNSSVLQVNTSATIGGAGQFVTGTFTANSSGSEVITLTANGAAPANAILNAVEVRAVPEPSVWAMLAAGAALLGGAMFLRGRGAKSPGEVRLAGATGTAMAAITAMVVCGSSVHGATITWGTPTSISGGGDVSTAGTLFDAANPGGTGVTAQTVSGVTFNPLVTDGTAFSYSDASGHLTLSVPTTSPSKISGGNSFGAPVPPFSNLSPASYQSLLGQGSFFANAPMTLTISGLTINQTYQVELWANFSDLTFSPPIGETVSAGNSTTLIYNTSATSGLGQFVIGTFTATSTTQQIALTAIANPVYADALLNAVEVRAVPEPPIPAMMLSGAACLLAVMRFRGSRLLSSFKRS